MMPRAQFEDRLAFVARSIIDHDGPDYEVTYVERESRSIGWADGKPSVQSLAATEGVCLRLQHEGGEGIVTTKTLEPARLRQLGREAKDVAKASSRDPHRRIARPAASYPKDPACATDLFSEPIDAALARLKDLEARVLKRDPRLKKVVKFSLSEGAERRGLANSHSLKLVSESSHGAFVAEILAEEPGRTEVAWDFRSHRFPNQISIDRIADDVATHALSSLGGAPIPSGNYPIVLHPRVGTQVLELLEQALSAEAVQLSRSFLRGLLNKAVASDVVNVVDDPFAAEGIAGGSFDDEGTPHQTLSVIFKGRLLAFFHDLRSAARDEVEPNGHASKESLGAPPHPGPTNLFIRPGASTREAMLGFDSKVFFVHEVMGLHMADPITGEFSFGASGALYERGAFSKPVRGVTIAGTVAGLLKQVTAVGNDLTWYGSAGSPSLLVTGLTVAGR